MKIETLEQLEAVPAGTVLRLANGEDWHNAPNLATLIRIGRESADEVLPAVTLIPSVISQEQLDKAAHEAVIRLDPKGYVSPALYPVAYGHAKSEAVEIILTALEVIGVSVDE